MNEQENLEKAIDYIILTDTLKWPLVIIIVILIFRKPLVDLINRVTKVGYGNKSLEAKQQAAEKKTKEISHIERIMAQFLPETIDSFKEDIATETEVEKLKSAEEKIDRLTNYSCVIYILRNYDTIYNSIFGSQIRILEHMNSHAEQTRESIKFLYDNAKKIIRNFIRTMAMNSIWVFFLIIVFFARMTIC